MHPAVCVISCVLEGALIAGVCLAQAPPPVEPEGGLPTFGVTVVAPYGFCGRIFALREGVSSGSFPTPPSPIATPGTGRYMGPELGNMGMPADCSSRLPDFRKLPPLGQIYTRRLNVPPRDFKAGFPGVTGVFEWFAIEYTARFWIETPGKYAFNLLSDDGSVLYIDGKRVIDNDCMHAPATVAGNVSLEGGLHDMRVEYFQGPRYQVALILYIKPPGDKWRVFNTEEFKPPPNPAEWKYPNAANLDFPADPCNAERRPKQLIRRSPR